MRSRDALNVTVWGEGTRVVLVHGSLSWGTDTWAEQRPLAEEYQLILVDRRGFGGSSPNGRVDFERDAREVAELLEEGAHLVGQSYGGVVCLLAAVRRTDAVRSLAVIEPPAFGLVRGVPAVEEVVSSIEEASRKASDPGDYRLRFLRGFGLDPQLKGTGLEAARSSWRERPPWEAAIPLEKLRGIRTLVVCGDWSTAPPSARDRAGRAFNAVCDVLEERLGAERATFPAAHNPQLLGQPFNERLRGFWEAT